MLYTTTALLHLSFFALLAHSAQLNYTGEAVTTRFWDCCKPSCGWDGKADVSHPVSSCSPDDKPVDIATGTGCNGGGAFQCSNQQPWAINDTLSYGFAGVFITPDLTGGGIEDAWCCACYRLDFTSEPLRGKSMVVQASNTAYDIHANRFSLAIPGGNNTSTDACARQYGVQQSVFGDNTGGVAKKEDCDKVPESLRSGCRWRFDWFEDASFPSANFQRVVCPAEISNKTNCVRKDEQVLSGKISSAERRSAGPSALVAVFAVLGVLSI